MNPVAFQSQSYPAAVWKPSTGRIAALFAYDTETTVRDDHEIPDYVLGTVCDGQRVWFIRRDDLTAFWDMHQDCAVFLHTAGFDLEVTTKACGFDFHAMLEQGRLRDISIYYRLLSCAKSGDVPKRYSLALMCRELLDIELAKDEATRKGFGAYYNDGQVDYRAIPMQHLEYAALDAVATWRLGVLIEERCRDVHRRVNGSCTDVERPVWGWLGHDIQLRGDIGLRHIEHLGIGIDPEAVKAMETRLEAERDRLAAILKSYGYIAGKPGNQAVFERIIATIEEKRGIHLPCTPKTGRKSRAAGDLAVLRGHEFVDAYLGLAETGKLLQTYLRHLAAAGRRAHPRYNLMVRTGRTSCSNPNVQNLPRTGGIRECIVPSSGRVLLACDYRMLELCTLAQIAYARFGKSAMRDLINRGEDLHRYVAARVLGKEPAAVTKDERQKAKAVNFGLPGGMGDVRLREHARANYGVELTPEDTANWRSQWLAIFPEMKRYLDGGDRLARLAEILDVESCPLGDANGCFAAAAVIRVAGGNTTFSSGTPIDDDLVAWAWEQIEALPFVPDNRFDEVIAARQGSRELQRAIDPPYRAVIPSGRIRAGCKFTESRNWPFQALAADGAKLALYDLARAGFHVAAFVHDEVLVEVSEALDYSQVASSIAGIMIAAMRRVCPDVDISVECAVMRRWSKDEAEPVGVDSAFMSSG